MTSLGRLLIVPIVTVITRADPVGVAMPVRRGVRAHPHDVHGVHVASPDAASNAPHERAVPYAAANAPHERAVPYAAGNAPRERAVL